MRISTLATCGLALPLLATHLLVVTPTAAQARSRSVGAVVVVSSPKEWKMAARVAEQLRQVPKVPRTRYVIVESAVPPEPRAELKTFLKRIRKARKLIHKLRPKPAIARLEAVMREVKTLMRTHGSTPGLLRRARQAASYLGAAHQLNADTAAAKAAFTIMLNIAPKRRLSPKYFSAAVIRSFERMKTQISRAATLRVNTDKPAFVFVDGHLRGVAPTVIKNVSPGFHVVEIRRLGAVRITRLLEVDTNLGATLRVRIVDDTQQGTLRKLLVKVERELRNQRKPGPAIARLAHLLKVDQLVACRAGLDDGEASLYDVSQNAFLKRVRRLSAIPGSPPGRTIAKAMTRPTPVMDLQTGSGGGGGSCESNADCPEGSCVSGRCVSETPFYKKWWFWTIVGLGVAAVAGGTAAAVTAPQRPAIRITLGAP